MASSAIGGLPRQFWWLWVGSLVNRAGTFIEPFFVLYLTGPRHISVRSAGFVLAVWGAGSLLSQPVGGFLTDRFGRRSTLAIGLTASAVVLMALSFARGLVLIGVMVFVLGLVADLYRPAATSMVADLVPTQDRARAYALQFWAINLGFSVAAISAGLLLHLGFGLLFALDAATTLVFAILTLRFLPETRPESDQPGARMMDPWRLLATDRLLLGTAALALAYAVVYTQVYVTLPLAIRASGLAASVYGYVISLNGVLIVVGQPLTLRWVTRWSRRATLTAGVALVGIGVGLSGLCERPWEFAVSVLVWTAGEILTAGSWQTLVADLAPPHLRGRYAGAVGLAWGASGLLGPPLGTIAYAASPAMLWSGLLLAGLLVAAGQYRLVGVLDLRAAAAARSAR